MGQMTGIVAEYKAKGVQTGYLDSGLPQLRKFRRQTGLEKVCVLSPGQGVWPFSLEGPLAVRFQRPHQANAMRSQTNDSAKAGSLVRRCVVFAMPAIFELQ
jgi:hypothetical protein